MGRVITQCSRELASIVNDDCKLNAGGCLNIYIKKANDAGYCLNLLTKLNEHKTSINID